MRVSYLHLSDTHGDFPPLLGRAGIIIHSGDFMPNRHNNEDPFKPGTMFGKPDNEVEFQRKWVEENATIIKGWFGTRKVLYCPGNHDFYDPTERLRKEGVDFVNLATERAYKLDGVVYAGFPFCPWDVRPWNYALPIQNMKAAVEGLRKEVEPYPEVVLVAHCPPANILDRARSGTRYGNTTLAIALAYELPQVMAVFCGHVHDDYGVSLVGDILVSNAATVVHRIELEFED